jgi:hypothetical protein
LRPGSDLFDAPGALDALAGLDAFGASLRHQGVNAQPEGNGSSDGHGKDGGGGGLAPTTGLGAGATGLSGGPMLAPDYNSSAGMGVPGSGGSLASPSATAALVSPVGPSLVAPMGASTAAGLANSLQPSAGLAPSAASPGTSSSPGSASPSAGVPAPGQILKSFGLLPLPFEPNVGQTDTRVQYLSHGPGFTLFLTANGATFAFARPGQLPKPGTPSTFDVVRLQFTGANAAPTVTGQQLLPGYTNYLVGNNPANGHAHVSQYGQVLYHDLYPGIDWRVYGNGRQLEYDFVVAPGADPGQIRLSWQGVQAVGMDSKGNLVLTVAGRSIVQQAPVFYQMVNGVRQNVSGGHVLKADGSVGFRVGAYDATKPLYLDPVLGYSTYLGGSGADYGYGVAVDPASAQAYVTGTTNSVNFPGTTGPSNGSTDVFVTKLTTQGTGLVYSTLVGGSSSYVSTSQGNAIAIDGSGNAYVGGFTTASDFPTTSNAVQSAAHGGQAGFLFKLNGTGTSLLYGTYLGGSSPATAGDSVQGVALDGSSKVFGTGYIYDTNFPTTSGAFQSSYPGPTNAGSEAFVIELNPSSTSTLPIYSSYLGGTSTRSAGLAIAVNGSDQAVVTGQTSDPNFPTTSGAFQTLFGPPAPHAFVFKMNSGGSAPVYSTFLGSSGQDQGSAVALDGSGNAFVTGAAGSSDFPTTVGAYLTSSAGGSFVSKLNASGTALLYSTYLGASGADSGSGIAVDSAGDAFVAGTASAGGGPGVVGGGANGGGGPSDAYVLQLNPAGSALKWSTYLGGSGTDAATAIALDGAGAAYVTGYTNSTDFPVQNSYQNALNTGTYDAFVSKLTGALSGVPVYRDPLLGQLGSYGVDLYSPKNGDLQADVPLDFLLHAPT